MKKLLFIIMIIITLNSTSYGYVYESIDIEKIKTAIQDEDSEFFYPVLFERYSKNDTTLNLDDYRHLYYGHALQPYYNPTISRNDDSARSLRNTLNSPNPDFKRVNDLANFVLRLDPFSIDAIYILGVSYEILGDEKNMNIYIDKFTKLVQTIIGSGDGKTPESAYTVISISDEYAFLNALGLKYKSQALIQANGKPYDHITVEKDEELGIESLYFNIELFFGKGLNLQGK
jgi:hypothetical protein